MSDVGSQAFDPVPYSQFLKYGPIGLAGLMLVLVIVALQIRVLDIGTERLMTRFLYIGGFCFTVASIILIFLQFFGAPHTVYFRVEPNDAMSGQTLPPPHITINSNILKRPPIYAVTSDIKAIVDVTDSIVFAQQAQARNNSQTPALRSLSGFSETVLARLNQMKSLAIEDSCSGGPHGIPTNHSAELTSLSTSALTEFSQAKATLDRVLSETAPTP